MKLIFKLLMVISLVAIASIQADAKTKNKKVAKQNDNQMIELILASEHIRVDSIKIAKDYLYAKNDIDTTYALNEMTSAMKEIEEHLKLMKRSISDANIKNLLAFIEMTYEDLKNVLKQPYSLDNAQVVIDDAEAIAEASAKIGRVLQNRLSKKFTLLQNQLYLINEIAKYYIAYNVGIRDLNLVRQMKKAVKKFESLLNSMANYSRNTPSMNKTVYNMQRLWRIVKNFYVNIESGGLPLIVYQTTRKLESETKSYQEELLKSFKK